MINFNKKIDHYLIKNYKKLNKNTFIIEIDLDRYLEVFNEWDKSNIKRRNIDPELENFLNECSSDIPMKYNIALFFYLPYSVKNINKEKSITDGIHNYFHFCLINNEKLKNQFFKKTFKYLFISLFFLLTASVLKIKLKERIIFDTLIEVIFIGGWVFMWETFSNLFISREDLVKEDKKTKRFLKAKIIFKYEERIR